MTGMRVWWVRNLPKPLRHFPVRDVDEAIKLIIELTEHDLKNSHVNSNAGGLEVLEGDEWCEYYNEDGQDIMEIIDEQDEQDEQEQSSEGG